MSDRQSPDSAANAPVGAVSWQEVNYPSSGTNSARHAVRVQTFWWMPTPTNVTRRVLT